MWRLTVSPGVVLLALFFVAPVALLIVYSVGSTDIVGTPTLGFDLSNYAAVVQEYNIAIVGRTVWYAVLTTAICLVIGYAVAYYCAIVSPRRGLYVICLVALPWLVDYLVRIFAWQQIFGRDGPVNAVLGALGVEPISFLGSSFAVVTGLVYGFLPLAIFPIYATLRDLDPALIEAGHDLYGGSVKTFFTVTLPSSMSGVAGAVLLVFLPTLGDFATSEFLGGTRTTMLGNIISDQFLSAGSQTFGAALTTSLVGCMALALALGYLLRRGAVRVRRAGA